VRRTRNCLPWAAALLLALASCMHSTWEQARSEDTLAGYSQFIRDHPGSSFVSDAEERMAYLRVKTYKTRESFEEFRKQYPNSALLPELRNLIEPLYFEQARTVNTPAAYGEYLRAYPDGALSQRARANQVYVSEVLPDLDEAKLRGFAEQHSDSDFKDEASRTLELLELQRGSRIRTLGVRVDVSPNVAQPVRVRQGFAALFAQVYRERGVQVSLLEADAAQDLNLDGWASVDYREAPASGVLGAATLLAHCRVRLYHHDFEKPIWDRSFEAPAEHIMQGAYGRDKTVFASSKYQFWRQFFVPIATWPVSQTQVQTKAYLEDIQDVDVLGERAALLLERGGVDFLDVSSPPAARVIDRYRRELDLAEWRGIRLLREDLAITFGSDGLELVRRTESSAERLAKFDGPSVGAVHAAALYDQNTLLFAGTQGLYALRMQRSPLTPQRLLDGEVIGVEVSRSHVVVVRPNMVEVALPKHLLLHLTEKKVSLGRFRAVKARLLGDELFLLGPQGVLHVSLANPQQPKVTRLLTPNEVGRIADLAGDGPLLYLLGERGLQIAVSGEGRVEDFIQVESTRALAVRGRFALLVGNKGLEVLDLSPYAMLEPRSGAALPAARAPYAPAPHAAAPADAPAPPAPSSDEPPPLPLHPEALAPALIQPQHPPAAAPDASHASPASPEHAHPPAATATDESPHVPAAAEPHSSSQPSHARPPRSSPAEPAPQEHGSGEPESDAPSSPAEPVAEPGDGAGEPAEEPAAHSPEAGEPASASPQSHAPRPPAAQPDSAPEADHDIEPGHAPEADHDAEPGHAPEADHDAEPEAVSPGHGPEAEHAEPAPH
jgi:hypothetical protein